MLYPFPCLHSLSLLILTAVSVYCTDIINEFTDSGVTGLAEYVCPLYRLFSPAGVESYSAEIIKGSQRF